MRETVVEEKNHDRHIVELFYREYSYAHQKVCRYFLLDPLQRIREIRNRFAV